MSATVGIVLKQYVALQWSVEIFGVYYTHRKLEEVISLLHPQPLVESNSPEH